MPPLSNVAVTTTANGPVGDDGRNVLAYDLTTGALVASCELPGTRNPGSLLYRPNFDDFLVTTTGSTAGGMLHRLDRALTLVASTNLAVPPWPSTDLLTIQLVRSDFQGGLYVTYRPSPSGTAAGDQLVRQIDPVTFAPLQDWRTFLTPDTRSFQAGDFSLDGQRLFFTMRGGAGPNQHVVYQLTLATGFATPFATHGTWTGGSPPVGNTYDARFIRPRADGTYVAATYLLSGATGNTLNELLRLAADGTVTAAYPLTPTLPSGTFLYAVSGLAVSGPTAWFVTGNGIFARMSLTTGVQTTIVETGINGLIDLVILPDVPPVVYTLDERHIRRLRRAPHVNAEHKRVFFRSFELDLERGQGLATGQGIDPLITLRLSRDGGQTWGEPVPLHAGRLGAYTQRVIARRLGQARDTVFEVTVSDPVAWSLVGAWLDLEPGTH